MLRPFVQRTLDPFVMQILNALLEGVNANRKFRNLSKKREGKILMTSREELYFFFFFKKKAHSSQAVMDEMTLG